MLPKLALVKQNFTNDRITDITAAITGELSRIKLAEMIKPGAKIGVVTGSRGIHAIAEMVTAIVKEVKDLGGQPIVIPGMGSHGGATAEGQVKVLKSLGITEETVGAPIISSMKVEVLGSTANGAPVYFDRNAMQCDGIIIINRIKPHTDFRGAYESGLMKMLAVGLGKHAGCSTMHRYGLGQTIPDAAKIILQKAPLLCGIGVIENALDKPILIEAVCPQDFESREPELLKIAKGYLPQIPFDKLDLLVVYEMGKNISGTGMDTNVLGRFKIAGVEEPERPLIKKVGVLRLNDKSYGNALGVGLADLTTKELYDSIDFEVMYANLIPTSYLERGKIPVVLPTDRALVEAGLKTIGPVKPENARVVVIKNTLELSRIYVSEALISEVQANSSLVLETDFTDWPFVNDSLQLEL